jgi:hypothetical protein
MRWSNGVLIFDINPNHSSDPTPLALIYYLAKLGKCLASYGHATLMTNPRYL